MMSYIPYENDYELSISHCDVNGVARPCALCDFMQVGAAFHASTNGFSREDVLARVGGVWMLSRLYYHIKRALEIQEVVHLKTFHRGSIGPIWYRDFIFDVDGVNVGHATTGWAIVELATARLMRPSSVMECINLDKSTGLSKITPVDREFFGKRRIVYSDLDINRHLNNTRAVELCSDGLRLQDKKEYVSELQINYIKQSVDNEILDLFVCEIADKTHVVTAKCENEVKLVMRTVSKPLITNA